MLHPHPLRSLGQHFLRHDNDYHKIIRYVGLPKDGTVLEVGPGPGSLTRAILETGQKSLVIIEKDRRFLPGLEALIKRYQNQHVSIIIGDVLKEKDFFSVQGGSTPLTVVTNLPYYISSPFLLLLCQQVEHISCAVIMLQKDLADRLLAASSTRTYGRLSVMLRSHFKVKRLANYPAHRFTPRPKVDSSLVSLSPLDQVPDPLKRKKIAELTEYAFHSRRKMLRNSLAEHPDRPLEYFNKLGLSPNDRAEDIDVEGYLALASCLKAG